MSLLTAYDIPYSMWVVFAVGTLICVAVGVAVGIASLFKKQEQRDGKG